MRGKYESSRRSKLLPCFWNVGFFYDRWSESVTWYNTEIHVTAMLVVNPLIYSWYKMFWDDCRWSWYPLCALAAGPLITSTTWLLPSCEDDNVVSAAPATYHGKVIVYTSLCFVLVNVNGERGQHRVCLKRWRILLFVFAECISIHLGQAGIQVGNNCWVRIPSVLIVWLLLYVRFKLILIAVLFLAKGTLLPRAWHWTWWLHAWCHKSWWRWRFVHDVL